MLYDQVNQIQYWPKEIHARIVNPLHCMHFRPRVGAAIPVASTIYVRTTPTNSMSTQRVKNNNNNNNKTVFLLKLVQELVTPQAPQAQAVSDDHLA